MVNKPMKQLLVSIGVILITSLMAGAASLYTDVQLLKNNKESIKAKLLIIEQKIDRIQWHLTRKSE